MRSLPPAAARPGWPTAVGLAGGLVADALLADPRRGHPVAAFGSLAALTERRLYRDSHLTGAAYALALTGGAAALGSVVRRAASGPAATAGATALATWAVIGGTSLRREARVMHGLLDSGDLEGARRRLSHLCGRDATELDEAALARATVESIAENTSDAVVGPLVWGAVAGMPGLLAYRAVNTLDAMVGYHGRYEYLGKASARLDDALNFVPARLTALFLLAAGWLRGADARRGLAVLLRDGGRTESPNAGRPMAAMAGLLQVELEKRGHYRLGDPAAPLRRELIDEACRIVVLAALLFAAAVGVALAAASLGEDPWR